MARISSAQILLVPALLMGSLGLAHADDFYKGRTLSIVVGFSTGGGYDLYGRNLARHLGKHIPGNPTIVVQNQPGAGSLTAVRSLDGNAPKDGTVMAIFNPGLVTQSFIEPQMVRVDFRKVAWIGAVTPDFRVCYGFGPNGVKSWDDMMNGRPISSPTLTTSRICFCSSLLAKLPTYTALSGISGGRCSMKRTNGCALWLAIQSAGMLL